MRKYISKSTKPLSVLLVFILTAFVAHAQNIVTGKVTDLKSGYGIQGVTVNVKGTKKSTQTDAGGNFSIAAAPTATLVFTSTGYTTKEVAVGSQSFLNISMEISVEKLSDVVIIGYGTVQKKDLTGSISAVTAKDFQKGSITSPEQLIAGKVWL